MVANDGTRAVDPSQYVAQHLQHFTASGPTAFATGDYARTFMWSANGLVVASVLLVVVTGLTLLTDRWPLFRLNPVMGFGKRLYLWWSCAWRQWLASTLFVVIGFFAFHSLVATATLPLMAFATHLMTSGATRTAAGADSKPFCTINPDLPSAEPAARGIHGTKWTHCARHFRH
jgi:hypothetical protein